MQIPTRNRIAEVLARNSTFNLSTAVLILLVALSIIGQIPMLVPFLFSLAFIATGVFLLLEARRIDKILGGK